MEAQRPRRPLGCGTQSGECLVSGPSVPPTNRTHSTRLTDPTLRGRARRLGFRPVHRTLASQRSGCSPASRLRRGFPSTLLLSSPRSHLLYVITILRNNLRRKGVLGSCHQQPMLSIISTHSPVLLRSPPARPRDRPRTTR